MLTECLLFVAKHHGRSLTPASLLSGLPLDENGRLTPAIVDAAARNAGLAARIVRVPLGQIVGFALPAVLFLNDDQACVLLESDGGRFSIAHPALEHGARDISAQELERYTADMSCISCPKKRPGSPLMALRPSPAIGSGES